MDDKTHIETLAIAFLTGQATDAETAEYKRLYESDPSFRNVVMEIGLWLAPLKDSVDDRPVPEELFSNIMEEIEFTEQATPNNQPAAINDNAARKWKMLTVAASLVAVLAIGSHFVTPAPVDNNNEQLMALLSDNSGPQLMAIVYEPQTGQVVARLSNITVPEDGDLQLWLIREGEEAPVSLGVLDRVRGATQIEFDISQTLQSGTDVLAVSLETRGGSKSAGPEGPVLYTGSLSGLRQTL